jgi:hypothetical protein
MRIGRLVMGTMVALLVLLSVSAPVVRADNSREAPWVLDCSWSFHGVEDGSSLAILDSKVSESEIRSMEQMEMRIAAVQIAGTQFHEYPDYPLFPQSVKKEDLKDWHCKFHPQR